MTAVAFVGGRTLLTDPTTGQYTAFGDGQLADSTSPIVSAYGWAFAPIDGGGGTTVLYAARTAWLEVPTDTPVPDPDQQLDLDVGVWVVDFVEACTHAGGAIDVRTTITFDGTATCDAFFFTGPPRVADDPTSNAFASQIQGWVKNDEEGWVRDFAGIGATAHQRLVLTVTVAGTLGLSISKADPADNGSGPVTVLTGSHVTAAPVGV